MIQMEEDEESAEDAAMAETVFVCGWISSGFFVYSIHQSDSLGLAVSDEIAAQLRGLARAHRAPRSVQ